MGGSTRIWRVTEHDPDPIPEFTPLVATTIDHELDLDTLAYEWTAYFSNPEPWAESSTSMAMRHYELRRDDDGWRMRLIGRNHSKFDTPREWEPAPAGFCQAWDDALNAWMRARG